MKINKAITFFDTRLKNHLIVLSILHALEKIGIRIVPYYLTLESLKEDVVINFPLQPVFYGDLDPPDIKELYLQSGFNKFAKESIKWTGDDIRCFGLRFNKDIVSYCWYNLAYCSSGLISFPLRKDEAYLFNARTMDQYRGSNLAPLLRYSLYQHLNGIGRTRFYSITEYFNGSALNFKNKLGAQHVKLFLYIGIFNTIKWNIILKNTVKTV